MFYFFMKNALLQLNENVKSTKVKSYILDGNVGKQSQNTQDLVSILAWQKSKAQDRVWIVQNDVHLRLNSTEMLLLK